LILTVGFVPLTTVVGAETALSAPLYTVTVYEPGVLTVIDCEVEWAVLDHLKVHPEPPPAVRVTDPLPGHILVWPDGDIVAVGAVEQAVYGIYVCVLPFTVSSAVQAVPGQLTRIQ
jgi:DNA-directed RNA polymerase subunit H (RpoH/RPB5)